MRPHAAEQRLLLDCARVRPDAGARASIDAALDAPVDWRVVLALARRHGLRPLLHRHVEAGGLGRIPRPVLVELWGEAASVARRNRSLARELVRIARLLEPQGIRMLPYKGPTLALAAYGDLAMREFGDLDILVARRDVLRAKAALCASGYAPEYDLTAAAETALLDSGAQYHLVLRSRVEGSLVELHWKSDPYFPVERLDDESYWAGLGRIEVEGEPLRMLGAEDLLLILLLHGAKHRWASLGWLVDVAELLRSGDAIDWERVERRADALGCRRRLGLGLHLAATLLGAPLAPAARALALEADELGDRLAAPLFDAEAREPGVLESLRLDIALYDHVPQRVRHVVTVVCSPSLVEWTRWPLPRALFFLYPALRGIRLAAKYLRMGAWSVLRRAKLHT